MRQLALLIALMFMLTACGGDDDSDPTTAPAAATPTESVTTPALTEADPTATDEAPEPTTTVEEATPTAESEPTATSEAADATATVDDSAGDSDLQQVINEIAEQTADVRGLPLLDEIDSQIINREELRENLLETIAEDYGQEQADLDRDVLWLLRLIPDRTLDYYALQIDLYTEQVAGYYNIETGQLFVIADEESLNADQRMTMAHEIVHAIQDQHFGLDRYDENDTDFDRFYAFQSLYEGDATWAMIQWAITNLTMDEISDYLAAGESVESGAFDTAPRYIQESLLFPYEAGFTFVEEVIAEGGVEAVNAGLEDPPLSTEQILHPEKFINEPRDIPLEVEYPELTGALGEGWEDVYDGTLGEFDFVILLEENGVSDGASAAAGWGGARFVTYQSGDDLLTVLATRWDTEDDATEFDAALRETMTGYAQDGEVWFDGERYHHISTAGDSVTLTSSTNSDALQAAIAGQ